MSEIFTSISEIRYEGPDNMFHAFIIGMDSFAFGLLKAAALIEDGRIEGRSV